LCGLGRGLKVIGIALELLRQFSQLGGWCQQPQVNVQGDHDLKGPFLATGE
jgi:hypothetical protein